jgi:hypothetical protein
MNVMNDVKLNSHTSARRARVLLANESCVASSLLIGNGAPKILAFDRK